MEWITPKTDWVATDRFNISDYNRIINNVYIVANLCSSLYEPFEIEDMGEPLNSYSGYWNVEVFNAIEINVESICRFLDDVNPIRTTFYPNGVFITYTELNRIEGITARFSDLVEGWLNGLMNLPFTLGRERRTDFTTYEEE